MIRRILLLLLLPLFVISCEDLEDNNPALQIVINGELFKANEMTTVTEEDGSYIIQGIENDKKLYIYLSDIQNGSYEIGEGKADKIVYIDEEGREFTTDFEDAAGEVLLTDSGLDYITGTFYFRTSDTSKTRLQAHNGHIYQVPFGSDLEDPDLNNQADYSVDGEEVVVNDVELKEVDGKIYIEILADNDQRISIEVPNSIAEGEIDLPDTDVIFEYYIDGNQQSIENGVLDVQIHETNLGMLRAIFKVTTIEHELEGFFQVMY